MKAFYLAIALSTSLATGPASPEEISGSAVRDLQASGRSNLGWLELNQLTAAESFLGDFLGQSISMSADGATIVAGASGADNSRGAVYVFVRPPTGWGAGEFETAKLTTLNGVVGDGLGFSVSVSEDGSTVTAGAPGVKPPGTSTTSTGAIYVFERPVTGWASRTESAKLTIDAPSFYNPNFALGNSVSASGDGSAVVAGVPAFSTDGDPTHQGAVCVFLRSGSKWTDQSQRATLQGSNQTANELLGSSVSISGDGTTIVSGAPFADGYRGALYIFQKDGAVWSTGTESAKLTGSDSEYPDELGALAVSLRRDGGTIIAGTPITNGGAGAVYVFERPNSGWATESESAKLSAYDGNPGDQFGYSVSISSDGSTLLVGALGSRIGGNASQGAAYAFLKPQSGWRSTSSYTQKLSDQFGQGMAQDNTGGSVALSKDGQTISMGAARTSFAEGSVYVFQKAHGLEIAPTLPPAPAPITGRRR